MRRAPLFLLTVIVTGIVVWWAAGDRIRAVWPRLLQPLSPHERYARALEKANLHDTAMGRAWVSAAARALQQPRDASAPFSAEGTFDAAVPAAMAWRFVVERGRRIEVDVELDGGGELFVDLYREESNETRSYEQVTSAATGARVLEYEPPNDSVYVLRVQPELLRGGRYRVQQRARATMRFPVQGSDRNAVRSVFGDERDRGARSHEGVDIFAPRGTPA